MRRVLIVDDEEIILNVLKKAASEEGYEVFLAENGRDALQWIEKIDFDLVLLDLRLPDMDGIEVLRKIRKIDEEMLVIIMTGYSSVESAVEAIKIGAYHYIKKPFRADYIKLMLRLALDKIKLSKEVRRLIKAQKEEFGFEKIVGRSQKIREVFALIKKIVDAGSPNVFITGESGTGKELVARAIHGMGHRAVMPYMEIDCASMPAQLLESELFGYEKGAFTDANQSKPGLIEEADKGTIFFDEIGDMDLNLQKKLLRVLEERSFRRLGGLKKIQVDFQIITATNKNLEALISQGIFREDLYYRLQVMPVVLPPLRERDRDVVLIAKYFLDHFNKKFKKNVLSLSPTAADILLKYPWPGNVRELKNVIERIVIANDVSEILPEHFPSEILSKVQSSGEKQRNQRLYPIHLPDEGIDLHQSVMECTLDVKKQLIEQALKRCKGNKTKAAKLLRLSRGALWRELQKLS
jgi:two-component system, NtrC family, response regulator AtoC